MLERLHKILARAGVAALRPAEDMILEGRVAVNGRIVRELGARADADADVITVDGAPLEIPRPSDPRQYVMLHKPVGVISTAHDTHGRPTVVDLVPNGSRIFPVGRLDADSEGLLLLTDDGDLAYRLTHPRFEVDKEYRVLVDRTPELPDLRRWRTGVEIDYQMTAPAWVEVLERADEGTWLRVVMREGRKRQIREVARALGMDVRRLIRVREGPLALADLAPGSWRPLTQAEIESLRAHTQHVPSREADEERERTMSEEGSGRRRLRVIRRPARGEAAYDRPTQENTSEPRDESSEMFAAGSDADFATGGADDIQTGPSEAQAPRRERSRFDQGRQDEQASRGGSGRSPQSDRRPYEDRGDRPQRPYGEQAGRSDDRRDRPAYGNERGGGDSQDRPAYGNDRNRAPYDSSRNRDRSGSMYGGGSRDRDRSGPMYGGGGSRDRNSSSGGGFRDRNGPSGGGFRDRNGPQGGSSRDRSGPMYGGGGSRDRNSSSGGGFRDRNGPSGGGFRDRSGPSGGGFRDRSGPQGGGFRDRSGPSGGGFRDRNGPSFGNNRDSRPTYRDERDRRGPDGNTRSGPEGGTRQGPSGERGFGRAPRNQGREGDRFNTRGPRSTGSYNDRPTRDTPRGFDRRPADFNGRRGDATGNSMERRAGPPANNRPPRSGGRDDRGQTGRNPATRPPSSAPRSRDDEE